MSNVSNPYGDDDARAAVDGQVDAVDSDTVDGQHAADISRTNADLQEHAAAVQIVLGGF